MLDSPLFLVRMCPLCNRIVIVPWSIFKFINKDMLLVSNELMISAPCIQFILFDLHMSFRRMSDHRQKRFLHRHFNKQVSPMSSYVSPSLNKSIGVVHPTVVSLHGRLDQILDGGVVDKLIVTSGQCVIYSGIRNRISTNRSKQGKECRKVRVKDIMVLDDDAIFPFGTDHHPKHDIAHGKRERVFIPSPPKKIVSPHGPGPLALVMHAMRETSGATAQLSFGSLRAQIKMTPNEHTTGAEERRQRRGEERREHPYSMFSCLSPFSSCPVWSTSMGMRDERASEKKLLP